MKLKLHTATRAEERSTQKQPTQLNMVAAWGTEPGDRPSSNPNPASSSFFSRPRSECICELTPSRAGLQLAAPLTSARKSLDIHRGSVQNNIRSGPTEPTLNTSNTHEPGGGRRREEEGGGTAAQTRVKSPASPRSLETSPDVTRDVCHTQTRVRCCHIRAGGGAGGGAGSAQTHQNTHEPSWSRSAQLCSRPNTLCLRTDRSGSASVRLDTVKLETVKVFTSGCYFQSKALREEALRSPTSLDS